MSRRKKGLEEAIQELDDKPESHEPTLEEFVRELHGDTPTGQANGMPSLDKLKAMFKTKSAAIRYLSLSEQDGGPKGGPFDVKDIAKHLGIRYQMVRNIRTNPLKRGPNEDYKPKPANE